MDTAQLRYNKYNIVSIQTGETLLATDFTADIAVKRDVATQMLADLHSFTHSRAVAGLTSRLEIQTAGGAAVITQNTDTGVATIEPNDPDLAAWKNPNILVPATLGANLVAQLEHILKPAGGEAVATNSRAELEKLALPEVQELLATQTKLQAMEAELGIQKQKDDASLSLAELEGELANLDEQMQSVQDLLKKRDQIGTNLAKFGSLVNQDLEAESAKLRAQLEAIRMQQLEEVNAAARIVRPLSEIEGPTSAKHSLQAKSMLLLVGMSVGISLLGFLLSQNPQVIMIGVTASFIELILFALINLLPGDVLIRNVQLEKAGQIVGASPNKISQVLAKIESFFVNKAWVAALRTESKEIEEAISDRLSGKDVNQLALAKNNLHQNIQNLQAEIEKLSNADISPQDYLQKRRELDMLNVEKAKILRNLREQPNYDQIMDLWAGVDAGATDNDGLAVPAELAGVLGMTKIVKRGIKFETVEDDEESEPRKLSDEELYLLVLWLKLQEWQTAPTTPMVVVNALTSTPQTAKLLLEQTLAQVRTLGQVVLVNLLP